MKVTDHYLRVRQFMQLAGQGVPEKPCIPEISVRILRARLILEECIETIRALGCNWDVDVFGNLFIVEDRSSEVRLETIIDGCCDIIVVSTGTLISCGVPDIPFLEEVDNANLRKFSGDAHMDAYGKWHKPSDWIPPDISGKLKEVCID